MKVNFFATFRTYTGVKETKIKFSGTVKELLQHLSSKYGSEFANAVFVAGEVSDRVIILVNGRNIVHLAGIDTVLGEEDEVSIFPVVAGG